eukprot:TRINITY_DN5217_c0_g1::TRINITY_DN5217_c0_g1_i1::g.23472::m.23472 TRINITY_DN5217_c0_g1::TRINITY_DN5217_c0_g1_i1::g.23472  ORF type:complete len:110 (+),score=4.92,sp/Q9USH2/YJH2_SCHPO/60.61/2e-07,Oxidored-like/PF09791.4/2.5e-15 TRINITY_DN5217_c0_g1_i1:27-356(+)
MLCRNLRRFTSKANSNKTSMDAFLELERKLAARNAPELSTESTKAESIDQDNSNAALRPPTPPGPEDCCQSGCANCVWTVYYKKLEKYEKAVAAKNLKQQETISPPTVV